MGIPRDNEVEAMREKLYPDKPSEIDRLRAENEALRKVVKAAAKFSAHTSWAEVHIVGAGARETLRTVGGME